MLGMKVTGIEKLEEKLFALSQVDLKAVRMKQLVEIHSRTKTSTPVDTGAMRQSSAINFSTNEAGYIKEYAPHVEYGHRTAHGGYVQGQRFLQKNVDTQRPIYKKDLKEALERI